MNTQNTLTYWGYFFCLFWIVSTITHFSVGTPSAVFWFCNFSVALMALACFERSTYLVYIVLAPAIILQTPIILDWTLFLLSDYSILQLGLYFSDKPFYFIFLSFMRHLITVPLGLFLLAFYFEPKKMSSRMILSVLSLVLVVLAISFLIPVRENINCIHGPCFDQLNFLRELGVYTLSWTMIVLGLVLVSLVLVQRIHILLSKNTKKLK